MKQKIVIKVQMNCQKCRTKALEVAAASDGANSVAIEGKEKELVVVMGEGVDPVSLTRLMRKKVGRTEVISVDEVKPKDEKKEQKIEYTYQPPPLISNYPQYPPFVLYETANYQEPGSCSIM
ncbi:heavy metal-associated isoprenylated plant protein 47-like isoform X2 [Tasmannia lanceolata]|uniref:heavy metal-associated isoprenylated plant protein 47-like isoform X2 n=1 Tax=Tasmannia lanceolata TaxID=3420 RepID=UPI0040641257